MTFMEFVWTSSWIAMILGWLRPYAAPALVALLHKVVPNEPLDMGKAGRLWFEGKLHRAVLTPSRIRAFGGETGGFPFASGVFLWRTPKGYALSVCQNPGFPWSPWGARHAPSAGSGRGGPSSPPAVTVSSYAIQKAALDALHAYLNPCVESADGVVTIGGEVFFVPEPGAGIDSEIWADLTRLIRNFIKTADLTWRGGTYPVLNILLVGPPGTGKSTIALHLAAELGLHITRARFDQFLLSDNEGKTASVARYGSLSDHLNHPSFPLSQGPDAAADPDAQVDDVPRDLRHEMPDDYVITYRATLHPPQLMLLDDIDRLVQHIHPPRMADFLAYLERGSGSAATPLVRVCTANSARMPAAVLSRFHLVEVPPPPPDRVALVLRRWLEGHDSEEVDRVCAAMCDVTDLRALRRAVTLADNVAAIPRTYQAMADAASEISDTYGAYDDPDAPTGF